MGKHDSSVFGTLLPRHDLKQSDFGPAGRDILPITIRPELTIFVHGIPHDLTSREAEKIAKIVRSYANQQ
jgi:hypothetical protein